MKEMDGQAHQRHPQQRIVIGVCTRQRNAFLRRLINSILAQQVPTDYSVELLVVDNNDSPVAEDALGGLSGPFPITVVHEAQAGLVYARNRALDEAEALQADWFMGLDDDEWVAEDWLSCFITGFETMARPVLIAPCYRIYDETLSPFIRPFQFSFPPQGDQPSVFATSNFAINRCVFDRAHGPGLRFDTAFNESGGEDLDFFRRAKRVFGWEPASFPAARAYEDWNDGERGALGYWLSRALRCRLNEYRVARHHRQAGIFIHNRTSTVQRCLRLNRQFFLTLGGLVTGIGHLPFKPAEGCHLIGDALQRGARLLAIVPFIFGATPRAYGKSVKISASRVAAPQTHPGHAKPESH